MASTWDPWRPRVAVIGAGTMGAGIAAWCAKRGCDVVLHSRRADGWRAVCEKLSRLGLRRVAQRALPRVGTVRGTMDFEALADREVVIEAVEEDPALKTGVLEHVARHCPAETLVTTTTSSLPIADLVAAVPHPERVLGLHFFNPLPAMPLVEVVRTDRTAARALARAVRFVSVIGKTPLVLRDRPGFLVNRVLFPAVLESLRLYAEHAATPAEIDAACVRQGVAVGPCAAMDVVGLDVLWRVCCGFEHTLGPTFTTPPLLARAVLAGQLGRKTGHGFYDYTRGAPRPDPQLDVLRADLEQETGRAVTTRFTVDRLLLPMTNETLLAVWEGLAPAPVVERALTETLCARPGLLARFASRGGATAHLSALDALAAEFGPRFAPSLALRDALAGPQLAARATARVTS